MQLLRIGEVSSRVGLCKATLYRLIANEDFPAPVHPSKGAARWVEAEIDAWMKNLAQRRSTV